MAIKLLFMGTPEFGATILRQLAASSLCEVVGVVTQPDRPAGRKNVLTPPPVKVAAQELGLPVMQVERLRDPAVREELRQFGEAAQVFVVASFGIILPVAVLDMPPYKCLNVHASLLPEYRGASPVAQAILDGRGETGVTIMQMEKGLDTGPMLSRVVVKVAPDETQPTLMAKLADEGGKLLLNTLPGWMSGQIAPEPQDDSHATLTGIIKKEDGRINWQEDAWQIERRIRAYDPWPGVYTDWQGQNLKILAAQAFGADKVQVAANSVPGQVLLGTVAGKERLLIRAGQSSYLAPTILQLPGRKPTPAADFLRGQPNIVGARLN